MLSGCLALFIIAGLLFATSAQRRRARPAAGWLQSQAAVVQLGVWHKSGPSGPYTALFIVTGPDGKQYKSEQRTKTGDDWVYTLFPNEFDKYPEAGGRFTTYSWECTVEGKSVGSGQFQWGGNRAAAP
jgi:hypothetical protein